MTDPPTTMTTPAEPAVRRYRIERGRLKIAYARPGNPAKDAELLESVRANGVLTELYLAADLTVLNGNRRVAAGDACGVTAYECVVDARVVTDEQKVKAVLEFDVQANRSPTDIFHLLYGLLVKTGWAQKELAATLGFSPSKVSRWLAPLDYGEAVLARMRLGELTAKHFEVVKRVADRGRREALLLLAAEQGLTAAQMMALDGGRTAPRAKTSTFAFRQFAFTYPDTLSVGEIEAGIKAMQAALKERLKKADKSALPATTLLGDE